METFDYHSTEYQADDLNIGDASFRERSLGESPIVEMFDCHQLNHKQMISISAMLPSGAVRRVSLNCGNV